MTTYSPEYFFDKLSRDASDLGLLPKYTMERCREIARDFNEIVRLINKKEIALLVHNYQRPEVQMLISAVKRGFIGDSFALALEAGKVDGDVLGCFVEFMGETTKLLAPNSRVLLPDRGSCSLVESVVGLIQENKLQKWQRDHPSGKTISYINVLASTKALADCICTSRNATKIVKKMMRDDPNSPILFMPDKYLAQVVAHELGIQIFFNESDIAKYGYYVSEDGSFWVWPGACYIHEQLTTQKIERVWIDYQARYPDKKVQVLLHPECGCTSSCMTSAFWKESGARYESTEGMLRIVKNSDADIFVLGTEACMAWRLRQEVPDKMIIPVSPEANCKHMKVITLENILYCLQNDLDPRFEVKIPITIAKEALASTNLMIEISKKSDETK